MRNASVLPDPVPVVISVGSRVVVLAGQAAPRLHLVHVRDGLVRRPLQDLPPVRSRRAERSPDPQVRPAEHARSPGSFRNRSRPSRAGRSASANVVERYWVGFA